MVDTIHLVELGKLFTKLGVTSFGGPAVHISMMHEEVVKKRQWMTEQHYLDLIGATNLIPGPNSTEMAIHIGSERAGWIGSIVSGVCFILPAVILTGLFAWFYKTYGNLPNIAPFFYGIKPAAIVVILTAILPLAKKSLKSVELYFIGAAALCLSLLNLNEIYIMFGAGFLSLFLRIGKERFFNSRLKSIFPLAFIQISAESWIGTLNAKLFLAFLKIGAILYGSGYVLFAFLDAELVSRGMITRQQLMDAIAVGQFTPGPLFSSVTFIGYQINNLSGAFVSTIGVFLPSFLFVILLNPMVKWLRSSRAFSAFLDSVNIASLAIIVVVCFQMGRETLLDWRTIVIFLLCLAISFRFKRANSAFIILIGAVTGYFLQLI